MRSRSSIISVIVFLSLAVFSAKAQEAQPPQGYLIGPGDVISIKALGEPSFDVEALTVDEDGKILIPYYETPIIAKCKTERALQGEVVQAWSKYLRKPQVYLRVAQRNSRPPVSIYGEVRDQKQINLTRRAYLLELLSFVGGETEKSGGMVQIFRSRPPMCSEGGLSADWKLNEKGESGMAVPSKMFSLASLRQGQEESNIEIFPGDVIIVPKGSLVYVTGEVRKPGEFTLPEEGLPLTQAIAMASGITREAKSKNVKIYRRIAGSPLPDIIAVNYDEIKKGKISDVMLLPFDIIEVDKAPKKFTDYLIEFATGIPNRIPINY